MFTCTNAYAHAYMQLLPMSMPKAEWLLKEINFLVTYDHEQKQYRLSFIQSFFHSFIPLTPIAPFQKPTQIGSWRRYMNATTLQSEADNSTNIHLRQVNLCIEEVHSIALQLAFPPRLTAHERYQHNTMLFSVGWFPIFQVHIDWVVKQLEGEGAGTTSQTVHQSVAGPAASLPSVAWCGDRCCRVRPAKAMTTAKNNENRNRGNGILHHTQYYVQ